MASKERAPRGIPDARTIAARYFCAHMAEDKCECAPIDWEAYGLAVQRETILGLAKELKADTFGGMGRYNKAYAEWLEQKAKEIK